MSTVNSSYAVKLLNPSSYLTLTAECSAPDASKFINLHLIRKSAVVSCCYFSKFAYSQSNSCYVQCCLFLTLPRSCKDISPAVWEFPNRFALKESFFNILRSHTYTHNHTSICVESEGERWQNLPQLRSPSPLFGFAPCTNMSERKLNDSRNVVASFSNQIVP